MALSFERTELTLERLWNESSDPNGLTWTRAAPAARDAWRRIESRWAPDAQDMINVAGRSRRSIRTDAMTDKAATAPANAVLAKEHSASHSTR
jgi:hypothetical protein